MKLHKMLLGALLFAALAIPAAPPAQAQTVACSTVPLDSLLQLFRGGQIGGITARRVRDVICTFDARLGHSVSIEEFGAVPDDGLDDMSALKAAIDSMDVVDGTVIIPSGVWNYTAAGDLALTGPSYGIIRMVGTSNVTVMGAGRDASIIKCLDGQSWTGVSTGDPTVFHLAGATNITIRDFTIDGDSIGNFEPANGCNVAGDQTHGIRIDENIGTSQGSRYITVTGMRITRMRADGIFLNSDGCQTTPSRCTEWISIVGNDFVKVGRAAIAAQTGNNVRIINNFFDRNSDAALDMEGTGARPGSDNLIIMGNTAISHRGSALMSATGNVTNSDLGNGFIIIGNQFIGAHVQLGFVDGMVFHGNTIRPDSSSNAPALELIGMLRNSKITSNHIVQPRGETNSYIVRVKVDNVRCAEHTTIADNTFIKTVAGANGVTIENCGSGLVFRNNKIWGPGTHNCINYSNAETPARTVRNVRFIGNECYGFAAGLRISITNPDSVKFADFEIRSNTFDDTASTATQTTGIIFPSSTSNGMQRLRMGDNNFERGITTTYSVSATLRWIIGGENGSIADWTGSGSPDGLASAVGSTYKRRDGTAGSLFYYKESGGSTGSGWVAKW